MTRRVYACVACLAIVGLVCASGLAGAGAADESERVTAKSVKIGSIFSQTGVAGRRTRTPTRAARRASRENAKGGVNGRKIDVVYLDDQSSGANLCISLRG